LSTFTILIFKRIIYSIIIMKIKHIFTKTFTNSQIVTYIKYKKMFLYSISSKKSSSSNSSSGSCVNSSSPSYTQNNIREKLHLIHKIQNKKKQMLKKLKYVFVYHYKAFLMYIFNKILLKQAK